ncbi:MAG: hypothetical protein RL410_312 [Actinomycetota bacterium]|jgi:protoporphyrinogen oxidase
MNKRTDVAIVGAGLSGLAAAITVQRAGLQPLIVEGLDRVGGRVRTDVIDGFTIDAGFQVFNPAYPAAKSILNYDTLRLQSFSPGVRVINGDSETLLGNPLRDASYLISYAKSIRARGISALSDVAKFGTYAGLAASKSEPDIYDCSAREALQRSGMSDDFIEHTIKPFLTGVFLENNLETSRRVLDFVLEYFIKGVPALPANGMAAIATQMAALLHADSINLQTWAHGISEHTIDTDAGRINADSVILATEQDTASAWLGMPNYGWRSVTTWYHSTPTQLLNGKALLSVDGDPQGPVINTVPISNAAPTYAPTGTTLISSSTLGTDTSSEMENRVRQHAAKIYGASTDGWSLVAVTAVEKALPISRPPFNVSTSVPCINGVFVAGDYLREPSINSAIASGVSAGLAAVAKVRGR